MPSSQSQTGPIEINWEHDGRVSVVGKDKHRFLITMQQAAEACARGHEQIVFVEELTTLLGRVHAWLQEHSSRVSAAYFAVVERRLVVFVMPAGSHMDLELSDEIAALEVDLFHDFSNVRCEVKQIPGHDPRAIQAFVNLKEAVLLHGRSVSTPVAVDSQS
jgi:hypothetical protein